MDSSVIEQEVVLRYFLGKHKFLTIEPGKSADEEGVKQSIEEVFTHGRHNIFYIKKLVGLNVDSVSINMGIHHGFGALMKEEAPY